MNIHRQNTSDDGDDVLDMIPHHLQLEVAGSSNLKTKSGVIEIYKITLFLSQTQPTAYLVKYQ